jgi:iron complex transport system substrate-binding protein
MMRLIFLLFSFCLVSCGSQIRNQVPAEKELPGYSRCFQVIDAERYRIIKVFNPWQNAENIKFTYILANAPSSLPDSLRIFPVIKTPVSKVVLLSTTHLGFISALGESECIVGISGKDYINDSLVRKSIEDTRCFDVGYAPNLNFERILSLDPDIVFLYSLDASVQSVSGRLAEAGIPCVMVSEYLEDHPLGKAEWIKFFAEFFNKPEEAREIFNNVQEHYCFLRDSIKKVSCKPKILAGLPWKDTWFLPGGKSFSAKFIDDAGGDYLWKNDGSKESIALDLESVFMRAINADIWINTGTVASKAELFDRDKRFEVIKAFRRDSLFNNNSRLGPGGGNDYWESGVIYPDLILQDLIEIFHPGILPKHELYYYRKLE